MEQNSPARDDDRNNKGGNIEESCEENNREAKLNSS